MYSSTVSKDPIAALALGETYGVRGQFAAAVRYLDQSIALTPSVWAGHFFKAWVFVNQDRGTARAWEVVRAAAGQVIDPGLLRMRANLRRMDRDYGAAAAIAEIAPSSDMVAGERWEMHYLAGQDALARTWADSARRVHESTLRSRPNYGTHARLGAVYAVLGRTADAIREAERAKELLPMTVDALDGTKVLWTAARTYLLVGRVEDAIDHLETLAAAPFRLGIPPLELDPIWDPIRDHHRFQALLAKYRT